MIIDTQKESKETLKTFAHLIEKDFFPDGNGIWNSEARHDSNVSYDKIIKDGRCIINFGYGGERFSLSGGKWRRGESELKDLESLKGFPEKCGEFNLYQYPIKNLDFIPIADTYYLRECNIEKISYPFPEKVKDLWLNKNNLKVLDNLPRLVETIDISNNQIESLEGIPYVTDGISFENIKTLKDISQLKGCFEELELKALPGIKSLPNVPKTVKHLTIERCTYLDNVDGVLSMEHGSTITINRSERVDIFTLLKSNAVVKYDSGHFRGKLYPYIETYERLTHPETGRTGIEDFTREEFENEVLNTILDKSLNFLEMKLKTTPFRTKSVRDKKRSLLKSGSGILKYNL